MFSIEPVDRSSRTIDLVALRQERVCQVRPDEAGTASDQRLQRLPRPSRASFTMSSTCITSSQNTSRAKEQRWSRCPAR